MYDKVKFKLYISFDSPWLNNLIFVIIFRNSHDFGGKNIELINIHKYANEATC